MVTVSKLIYCFDIDNTLCKTEGKDYENSQPINERIAKVNWLFKEGHTIKIFTARGSGSGIDWRDLTEAQLDRWGVLYHELIMMKPAADFYVDDRAIRDSDFDWNSKT
jgi:hypothetical protein